MTDLVFRNDQALARARTDWGAVWAGMFTFIAIWAVFGILGLAIFASAANPARPVGGVGVGMGIWSVILTIIAMYVAGRETGRLAAVSNRHDGLVHGMIMFGLSVLAVLVIAALGDTTLSGGAAASTSYHNRYSLQIFSGLGWTGFFSLFLGWLAAMMGASSGVTHKVGRVETSQSVQQHIRPAA